MRHFRSIIISILAAGTLLAVYGAFQGTQIRDSENNLNAIPQASRTPIIPGAAVFREISRTTGPLPQPNDPYYARQWGFKKMLTDDFEVIAGQSDSLPLVAVLDTGIDKNHEDLKEKVIVEVNLVDGASPADINGHGTHIAGIIGANANNQKGVAGLAPASRLMNIKVVNDQGSCESPTVARGIIWAADHGANVINLSIEFKSTVPQLENAVDYAWHKGALVIASASNQTIQPVYPAYYEHCLAIAATDSHDELLPLSGYGNWVDIAAPGIAIFSTLPDDKYGYRSGTSFAAAHITALAALLYGIAEDTNRDGRLNDEVRSAIVDGARKVSRSSVKRVDAGQAALKLREALKISSELP